TRRAGPLALHPAAHEAGLAGAARAGRALVGQLDARAQAGMEDLLSGLALELALSVPGLDGDLHGCPITSVARHLDRAHGLLVGKVAQLERAPQMCAWASTIRTPGMVSRSSEQVKADPASAGPCLAGSQFSIRSKLLLGIRPKSLYAVITRA